jgi:hypothetical protein
VRSEKADDKPGPSTAYCEQAEGKEFLQSASPLASGHLQVEGRPGSSLCFNLLTSRGFFLLTLLLSRLCSTTRTDPLAFD